MNDETIRQHMACGFLDPIEGARPWVSDGMLEKGIEATVCARYSTELPDVIDTAIAYGHCEKGGLASLRVLCGDQSPPASLMRGIEILGGSIATEDAHRRKRQQEEAKRNGVR